MTVAGDTTNYSYDDASRLATVTPPSPASAISYTWDENGDLTARGSDSFGWDYEDRMTSATVGGTGYTYTYRGDGLRNSATTGGVTKTSTWDINAGLPVVLDDGAQYVYGNGLISQVAGANTYYYLSDGLGSVLKTTDASGNVVNGYTYDVYGKTTSSSGSQANDVQFAGQQTDPTGLQYLRARYYDPETGGFLSRDPLSAMPGWAGNPFGYAGGNPASRVDPTGLRPDDGSDNTICAVSCWMYDSTVSVGYDLAGSGWWIESHWVANVRTNVRACRFVGEYTRCTDSDRATAEMWKSATDKADAELNAARVINAMRRLIPWANAIASVTFGHGYRHVDDPESVERAIEQDIQKRMSISPAKAGQEWREIINVNGQNIEYRAYVVEDGWVNVGTYVKVP